MTEKEVSKNNMTKKSEHKSEEKSEEKSEKKSGKSHFAKKLSKNYWAISTVILVILLMGALGFNQITGCVIATPEEAGQKIIDFAKEKGTEATLVSVKDEGSLYEVIISIQDQQVPIYVTKDGKNLVQGVYSLEETQTASQTTTQTASQTTTFTEEELVEISGFMQCLANSGVKVYGADWCGYTKQLVTNLGGYGVISPIYLECQTANRQPGKDATLCESEGIQGFPTIKINGEQANIARTLEGFAEATGCKAPSVGVQASTAEATC